MALFRPTTRGFAAAVVVGVVALGSGSRAGARIGAAAEVPGDAKAVAHALNRLAFGARPGDLERVTAMGLGRWIDQQLQPDRIPDEAIDRRLASLTTLRLDAATIAREYFVPARMERQRLQRENAGRQQDANAEQPMAFDAPPGRGAMSEAIQKERQVFAELSEAKLLRAVYSERQLDEVLTDFWFNHFNVFARKGRTGVYMGQYERDAIRPHVLGSFRDLLEATAKSPAMLFYLDNWMSADPNAAQALNERREARMARFGPNVRAGRRTPQAHGAPAPAAPPQQARQPRGLNENYARELLELHTLGVDGGYTQQDVIEVARAFTGWTIGRPDEDGFRFAAALHDRGAKKVLGVTIPAGGGIEDGEKVLDILARHPATARHIAFQLAQRFVSDAPPQALVDRAAKVFQSTNGNLREVVRAIVTSPQFFAADAYRAKVKTPFEFVASALRATGAEVESAAPVVRALGALGMPLYLCQPPTGYDEIADRWVSSGALVNRMNFALAVAGGQMRGVQLPSLNSQQPAAARDRIVRDALAGDVSATTLATIGKATTVEQTIALAIGSPEFQRQ